VYCVLLPNNGLVYVSFDTLVLSTLMVTVLVVFVVVHGHSGAASSACLTMFVLVVTLSMFNAYVQFTLLPLVLVVLTTCINTLVPPVLHADSIGACSQFELL
jgi:hypothetical protein